MVFNHADYRLISSRVLREFANFKEVNIFLRGMIPLVGFKSTSEMCIRDRCWAGILRRPPMKSWYGSCLSTIVSLPCGSAP